MGEAKTKKEQYRHVQACVYCGAVGKTTRDHVPPKGIFPQPRPQKLVTVPACEACNGGASQIDEAFKLAIAMQASAKRSPMAGALQKEGAASLRNNRRSFLDILRNSRERLIKNEFGVLKPAMTYLWPAEHHDEVIRRTTQGLYFYHTGNSLFDLRCNVNARYHGRERQEIPDEAKKLFETCVIGEQQFTYSFAIVPEDPRRSEWLYEFYGTHYASASTVPRDAEMELVEVEP